MGYPKNQIEFEKIFSTEEKCLSYLISIKWEQGFECKNCGSKEYWVAALLKRWLLGTHQNFVSSGRLQSYLDEYTFRYNRRKSKSRGLLFHRIIQQAMKHEPVKNKIILESKDSLGLSVESGKK